jgi:methyl-accepting chemotaxis protein
VQFLSGLSMAQRLMAATVLVALVLFGSGYIIVKDLDEVSKSTSSVAELRMPQLIRIDEAELSITRASLQLRHAMLSRTPEELQATLVSLGQHRALYEKQLKAYEDGLFTPAGRQAFEGTPAKGLAFLKLVEENIGLIQAGQKDQAFAHLVDKVIPVRNELLDVLSALKTFQKNKIREEMGAIKADLRETLIAVMVSFASVLVVLVGSTLLLGTQLRARAALASAVAESVRDGDLRNQMQDTDKDEFSPLLRAMTEMQDSLRGVVGSVRGNADSVATASSEIAQGNLDLSQRTEQQASSVQQTASTMDELGATVRQNADNAQQANQLAQGASTVAAKGGEVVGQVVNTMRGISESSRRIGDIIGTIDGIAFQTNILALNAAVEAARAGEAGRGFAVVASEVRLLAQRSAEAAKEIKTLIAASVERVELGTSQVDQAGRTMDEVVAAIRRVTDIVGEISSASQEQASGIALAGESITQMEQTTQQNAALVEESAAAAETLRLQAHELVNAVSTFKL